jgi:mono/diheme cytochrome c family protein
MKTVGELCTTAALLIGALLGVAAASADPASSTDSAWSNLPAQRNAALTDPLERRGKEVFDQRCAACHGEIPAATFGPASLPPMPGTRALEARYRGALPATLEERTDLAPEYVRTVVRQGYLSMPFFRPTELSAEDLDALTAYLTRERVSARE